MQKLTIKHIEGSTETTTVLGTDGQATYDKQPYDLFVVTDGQHEVEVHLFHADDNNPEDSICISNSDACALSGINGSLHLSACVSMTILKHFTEDHSFYSDGFYDDNGHSVEHDLIVL